MATPDVPTPTPAPDPVNGRVFDWQPNHDPKSKQFSAVRGAPPTERKTRTWKIRNAVLDQGQEGACVGHGVINACSAAPMSIRLPAPQTTAFGMYYGSRYIDDYPGEDYDGTSVNAGCKLAVTMGFAASYKWAFGVEELAHGVLEVGPAVIGINWYESMYSTDFNGLVNVDGAIAGGHCICVTGFKRSAKIGDYTGPVFRWRNSWGLSYGINGDGFIPYDVMDALLKDQGEAAFLDPIKLFH